MWHACILENTFTAVPDVASHYLPWLPWRALLHTRLDSLALIKQYHGPLLQTHGDADGTVAVIKHADDRIEFPAAPVVAGM